MHKLHKEIERIINENKPKLEENFQVSIHPEELAAVWFDCLTIILRAMNLNAGKIEKGFIEIPGVVKYPIV